MNTREHNNGSIFSYRNVPTVLAGIAVHPITKNLTKLTGIRKSAFFGNSTD